MDIQSSVGEETSCGKDRRFSEPDFRVRNGTRRSLGDVGGMVIPETDEGKLGKEVGVVGGVARTQCGSCKGGVPET